MSLKFLQQTSKSMAYLRILAQEYVPLEHHPW